MSVKRRILIKGKRVHNVGYRPYLMEKAQEEDIMSIEDFSGVLSASQHSKIVQTGLGMFEMLATKQDQMLTKQDETTVSIRNIESLPRSWSLRFSNRREGIELYLYPVSCILYHASSSCLYKYK